MIDSTPAHEAVRTIVLAGGGSGGHLSPGLAVAEALHTQGQGWKAHFLCSERAVDREMLGHAGVDFTPIPASPGWISPRALWSLRRAVRASRETLARLRATALLSLGGFVSVPAVWSAWRLGVPVVMLNLDVVAGRANRLMSRFSTKVLSAVPVTNLHGRVIEIVGMPIRRAARAPGDAAACRARLGLDPAMSTLLVTGASQGSSSLNEAVPSFVAAAPSLMRGWQVLHLSGAASEESRARILSKYIAGGVPAAVLPFLHEMGIAWGAATIAVTRAGASSVAEAAANRVPAIFVPFPFHHDQHQRRNALALVERGAALLARDPVLAEGADPPLASVLSEALADGSFRERAAKAFAQTPPEDASTAVARELMRVARPWPG